MFEIDPVTGLPILDDNGKPKTIDPTFKTQKAEKEYKAAQQNEHLNNLSRMLGVSDNSIEQGIQQQVQKQSFEEQTGQNADEYFPNLYEAGNKTFGSIPEYTTDEKKIGQIENLQERGVPTVVGADQEDLLGEVQSNSDKIANGVVKYIGKTVANAAGAIIGTAYGIPKAIQDGEFKSFYDNEFTRWSEEQVDKMDEALPNYVTKEAENYSLLQSLGTTNFWANDVLGGMSFVAGALLSEYITAGLATGANLGRLGKILKYGDNVADLGKAAKIQSALNKGDEALKFGRQLATGAFYEAGLEARNFVDNAKADFVKQFTQQTGREPNDQEMAAQMSEIYGMANNVFAGNAALVSLSNMATLPQTFGPGLMKRFGLNKVDDAARATVKLSELDDAGKRLLAKNRGVDIADIEQEILSNPNKFIDRAEIMTTGESLYKRAKGLLSPLSEGAEELGQAIIGETALDYIASRYDEDGIAQTDSYVQSFTDAIAEKYGDSDFWKEGFIGLLIGAKPSVNLNRIVGGDKSQGAFQGGIADVFKNPRRNTEAQAVLGRLNSADVSQLTKELAIANVRNARQSKLMDDATELGDMFRAKNAENQQFHNIASAYYRSGRLDQFEDESVSKIQGMDTDSFATEFGYENMNQSELMQRKNEVVQAAKERIKEIKDSMEQASTVVNIKDRDVHDALAFSLSTIKNLDTRQTKLVNKLSSLVGGAMPVSVKEYMENLVNFNLDETKLNEIESKIDEIKAVERKALSSDNPNLEETQAKLDQLQSEKKELLSKVKKSIPTILEYKGDITQFEQQVDNIVEARRRINEIERGNSINGLAIKESLKDLKDITQYKNQLTTEYNWLVSPQGRKKFRNNLKMVEKLMAEGKMSDEFQMAVKMIGDKKNVTLKQIAEQALRIKTDVQSNVDAGIETTEDEIQLNTEGDQTLLGIFQNAPPRPSDIVGNNEANESFNKYDEVLTLIDEFLNDPENINIAGDIVSGENQKARLSKIKSKLDSYIKYVEDNNLADVNDGYKWAVLASEQTGAFIEQLDLVLKEKQEIEGIVDETTGVIENAVKLGLVYAKGLSEKQKKEAFEYLNNTLLPKIKESVFIKITHYKPKNKESVVVENPDVTTKNGFGGKGLSVGLYAKDENGKDILLGYLTDTRRFQIKGEQFNPENIDHLVALNPKFAEIKDGKLIPSRAGLDIQEYAKKQNPIYDYLDKKAEGVTVSNSVTIDNSLVKSLFDVYRDFNFSDALELKAIESVNYELYKLKIPYREQGEKKDLEGVVVYDKKQNSFFIKRTKDGVWQRLEGAEEKAVKNKYISIISKHKGQYEPPMSIIYPRTTRTLKGEEKGFGVIQLSQDESTEGQFIDNIDKLLLEKEINTFNIELRPKKIDQLKSDNKVIETSELVTANNTQISSFPSQDFNEWESFVSDNSEIINAIDDNSVYIYDGMSGIITKDGQQVIFETNDKIIELGNINDISTLTFGDFGIVKEVELNIDVTEENNVWIDGVLYYNNYSNPLSAINKDKEGNYSVSLENVNGQKRTFRGQRADKIVYEYKLKNFKENANEEQINRANELTDEAIRTDYEIGGTAPKRKNKSIRKGRRKTIKDESIQEQIPAEISLREQPEISSGISERNTEGEEITEEGNKKEKIDYSKSIENAVKAKDLLNKNEQNTPNIVQNRPADFKELVALLLKDPNPFMSIFYRLRDKFTVNPSIQYLSTDEGIYQMGAKDEWNAMYDPATDTIFINSDKEFTNEQQATLFIEETLHSQVYDILRSENEKNTKLKELFKDIKSKLKNPPAELERVFENYDEFYAALFYSKELRDYLSEIPSQNPLIYPQDKAGFMTFLHDVLKGIIDIILGKSGKNVLYTEATALAWDILDNSIHYQRGGGTNILFNAPVNNKKDEISLLDKVSLTIQERINKLQNDKNREFVKISQLKNHLKTVEDTQKIATFVNYMYSIVVKNKNGNSTIDEVKKALGGLNKMAEKSKIVDFLYNYKDMIDSYTPIINEIEQFYLLADLKSGQVTKGGTFYKIDQILKSFRTIQAFYDENISRVAAMALSEEINTDAVSSLNKEIVHNQDRLKKLEQEGKKDSRGYKDVKKRLDSLQDRFSRTLDSKGLQEELEMGANEDMPFIDFLLNPAISSSNPVLALFAKKLKHAFENARLRTRNFAMQISKDFEEYKKVKGYSSNPAEMHKGLYEIVKVWDENTKKLVDRVSFISPIDVTKFNTAKAKMLEDAEKVDEAKRDAFIANWYNGNMEKLREDDLVINGVTIIKGTKTLINERRELVKKSVMTQEEFDTWVNSLQKIDKATGQITYNREFQQPKMSLYKNDKFDKITDKNPNTVSENTKKYYAKLISAYFKAQEIVPVKNGFIAPSRRKSKIEYAQNNLKEGIKDAVTGLVNFKEDEQDVIKDNRKIIPVLFSQMMDAKDTTLDLTESVLEYYQMAERYKAASSVEKLGKSVLNEVVKNKPVATSALGRKIESIVAKKANVDGWAKYLKKNNGNNVAAAMDAFIDMNIYNMRQNKEEFSLFGKTFDFGKIANNLMSVGSFTQVGGNPLAAVSNSLQANVSTIIESAAKEFFPDKDLAWAKATYHKNTGNFVKDFANPYNVSLIGQMIDLYDPMQGNYVDKLGNRITKGQFLKLFQTDSWFFLQHWGEFAISTQTMLAVMHQTKVKDKEGKDINLYEAYTKDADGKIKLKEGVVLDGRTSDDKMVSFDAQNRIHAISKRLQGVYNKLDAPSIARHSWGRLLLMYRKHLAPGFKRRYKKFGVDQELGATTEGFYNTFIRIAFKQTNEMLKELSPFSTSDLSPLEKANLRRAAREMLLLLSTGAAAMILEAMMEGADDDEKKAYSYMLYWTLRLNGDLSAYTGLGNPRSLINSFRSPSAGYGTLEKGARLLEQIYNFNERAEKNTILLDKGELKVKAEFLKFIGKNGMTLNPEEAVKILQMKR